MVLCGIIYYSYVIITYATLKTNILRLEAADIFSVLIIDNCQESVVIMKNTSPFVSGRNVVLSGLFSMDISCCPF